MFFFFYLFLFDQVTEQLQASIESRTTEAKKSYHSLEEKLLKAAVEKQELEEQNKRAQISFDEQVLLIHFNIFSSNDAIICFYYTIKNTALHRWTVSGEWPAVPKKNAKQHWSRWLLWKPKSNIFSRTSRSR